MFGIYSFNSGQNVTKRGRITKRRSKSNLVKPKFDLKSFHPSSQIQNIVNKFSDSVKIAMAQLG